MRIFNDSFTIQSEARPTFHDVTDRVAAAIKKQGVITGVAMVYSQHTTCSVSSRSSRTTSTTMGSS